MNVKIETEAAQFPEKEYISGIFLTVWWTLCRRMLYNIKLTIVLLSVLFFVYNCDYKHISINLFAHENE
jgi:hypothetical protein